MKHSTRVMRIRAIIAGMSRAADEYKKHWPDGMQYVFLDALREVLGLDPLYVSPPVPAEIVWWDTWGSSSVPPADDTVASP